MNNQNSNSNSQKTIKFPSGAFLSEAKKEYSGSLIQRLLIELFQNSLDAGATEIQIAWNEIARELHFIDNGKGMDINSLENGLLTFEASIKEDGNVGGFGAAKKLILFSHPKWEIITRISGENNFLHAQGGSIHYEFMNNNFRDLGKSLITGGYISNGTGVFLTLDEKFPIVKPYGIAEMGNSILENVLRDIISKSTWGIRGKQFRVFFSDGVNPAGEIPVQGVTPELISLETATVREGIDPGEYTSPKIITRFNGLFMFETPAPGRGEINKKGYFYDVNGKSTESLDQNRQGFRYGTKFYSDYWGFQGKLTENNSSGIAAAASHTKSKNIEKQKGLTFMGKNPHSWNDGDGIQYSGPELENYLQIPAGNGNSKTRLKISKREKMIYSLCKTVGEMIEFPFNKSEFGFYLDNGFRGLYADGKIWINPTYFQGGDNGDGNNRDGDNGDSWDGENKENNSDKWVLEVVEVFIHEYCHYRGHAHNESFISLFGQLMVKFMEKYRGVNPLKARMREIEKREF